MNSLFKHTAFSLACATMLALTATPAAFAKDEVPFNGSWNTVHDDTLILDPTLGPVIAVEVHGEGQASHLGNAQCFSDDQIAILATGIIIATYTYTAANGDLLLLYAVSELVGSDPITQKVDFIGTFEILGGTGRFAGATGWGSVSGWAIFEQPFGSPVNSGPGFFEFEGVISSVGAAKK